MKLSYLKMLFLLGCIVYFGDITSLSNHFVDAKIFKNFSEFEIEEQLKVINKPAMQIIKTTQGDLYGCVDFYKQPAFDHPLMKNHISHYKMQESPILQKSRSNNEKFGYLWENGIGCPIGTVPIKRISKDELLRLNMFSDKFRPQGSWNFTYSQYNVNANQHHFAVSRTKTKGKSYYGAAMIMTVNDPKVEFEQYSSARMHIQIGDDFIQAGWTVNPKLYSDKRTRTFVYAKIGENQCYNNMCSVGIIMVRPDISLGMDLGPPAIRGSPVGVYCEYGIFKDKANGNWWLKFGGHDIGYWPEKIFQESSATNIEWGGEVYSASMPSPQMGNGHFPVARTGYDAIIFNRTIVDESFKIVENIDREAFSDNTRGYNLIDGTFSEPHMINKLNYGGPGNI
ncbi:hypothetical protein CARUB_v10024729mg [Capsella rubella]|uniref:Neprosin PEP catalytic domain-containing protein n=1 Tax=Capsella rubella TaxID=81985 RepID=R0HFU8_9BRAS|nr:uncharacterized protein LOC17890519 [Capsella rubella]EOA28514.1 hypothetical protein CARUB_v10024729mg [Capsella rubella]